MADKSFGVKELNLLNASGTPTVTSPNNLNLNANTVAISTSCTIGNNLTVTSTTNSANLNVTGIGTLTRAFATDLSVSGVTTITVPANANPHSSWDVVNNSASAYRFTGPGQDGAEDNPNIYLVRGQRYVFKMNASGHPFQIRVANAGAAYSDGVTNNGSQTGNVVFNVQHDAPAQLFYQCTSHGSMVGNIYIVGGPQVISGVVTATSFVGNLTGDVTGALTGAATRVTVTDQSSDTSCNVLFVQGATGDMTPHSGTNLTFNSSTGALTATSFAGDGSNITNLNASNIASGTVPTARLGSGTASSSTFLRGDSTFQTVNTDLVSDTSPQLGGDLASNGQDILFANNDKVKFGTGNDAAIYHNDTDFVIDAQDSGATRNIYIDAGTVSESSIYLRSNAGDTMIKAITDGSVLLYYDNALKFRTMTDHCEIRGHLLPDVNNTDDIGSSSKRFRNIYTNDLNLSNEGSVNSVDNTWGNYTIQEGESDLYLINNRNGKKYKFNLTEVN